MRIKSIKQVGKQKVYDIEVADVNSYTLENQTIVHNSGAMYSSNVVFIIGRSQEKDGTDLSGYTFTLNVEKSRDVREKSKLKFKVLFETGIVKYSGLLDIGIASDLKEALAVYTESGGTGNLIDDQTVDTVPHMLAKFEVVQGILNGMGYGKYFEEDTRGKLEAILEVENFVDMYNFQTLTFCLD
jgi:hypothetical protein